MHVIIINQLSNLPYNINREIIEDLRRRKSDLYINNQKATVYSGKHDQFKQIKWSQVNRGDIIEVRRDEVVPADGVILATSEPLGICYIDTASLDGESNLKIRQSLHETTPFAK